MDRRVRRVIALMKHSLALKLSGHALAKSVNLSAARLRQLFKQETSISPIRYLRRLRTKRAAYLLRTSFMSVKEVAFQTGSGDVSHFVRDFKKHYGVTPTEFRVRIKASGASSACSKTIS